MDVPSTGEKQKRKIKKEKQTSEVKREPEDDEENLTQVEENEELEHMTEGLDALNIKDDVKPEPSPPEDDTTATSRKIKVVSWNVDGVGSLKDPEYEDSTKIVIGEYDYSDDKITLQCQLSRAAVARRVLVYSVVRELDADVLLLQEVRTDILLNDIIAAGKEKGREYQHVKRKRDNEQSRREAQVLYDEKIFKIYNEQEDNTEEKKEDEVMKKRACFVTLRMHMDPESIFTFISFHNHSVVGNEVKKRYVQHLFKHEVAGKDHRAIAGCDFNLDVTELSEENKYVIYGESDRRVWGRGGRRGSGKPKLHLDGFLTNSLPQQKVEVKSIKGKAKALKNTDISVAGIELKFTPDEYQLACDHDPQWFILDPCSTPKPSVPRNHPWLKSPSPKPEPSN